MNNNLIIKILYDKEVGQYIRDLLENLCSPDRRENDKKLEWLFKLIMLNFDDTAWWDFSEFLYENIHDLLTYFEKLEYNLFKEVDITDIIIPKNIKEIGMNCFSYNNSLVNVSFESGSELTALGGGAFNRCTEIKKLDLSNTKITQLADQSFYNLNEAEILLPNTVKIFGVAALVSYNKVIFPTVNYIDDLELDINKFALINQYGEFIEKVDIITKNDSDIITKDGFDAPMTLGPKLSKNPKIHIWG